MDERVFAAAGASFAILAAPEVEFGHFGELLTPYCAVEDVAHLKSLLLPSSHSHPQSVYSRYTRCVLLSVLWRMKKRWRCEKFKADALIADEARDLIIAEEVSSKAAYSRRYRHPEWARRGVRHHHRDRIRRWRRVKNKAQLHKDWDGKIRATMISVLEPCIGVTRTRARNLLPSVRPEVDVPWEAAISVFEDVDVPRWHERCKKALPNFEALSPACKGALVSLAYNRGIAFSKKGDHYADMRKIRALMAKKDFEKIPAHFRKMRRLWRNKSNRGVAARLFEKGLMMRRCGSNCATT